MTQLATLLPICLEAAAFGVKSHATFISWIAGFRQRSLPVETHTRHDCQAIVQPHLHGCSMPSCMHILGIPFKRLHVRYGFVKLQSQANGRLFLDCSTFQYLKCER